MDMPLEEFEIPWPILRRPLSYNVQDIAVEWVRSFFDVVRSHPRVTRDYLRSLIVRGMEAFHGDKLIACIKPIEGDEDKVLIQRASKTVYRELHRQWKK